LVLKCPTLNFQKKFKALYLEEKRLLLHGQTGGLTETLKVAFMRKSGIDTMLLLLKDFPRKFCLAVVVFSS